MGKQAKRCSGGSVHEAGRGENGVGGLAVRKAPQGAGWERRASVGVRGAQGTSTAG